LVEKAVRKVTSLWTIRSNVSVTSQWQDIVSEETVLEKQDLKTLAGMNGLHSFSHSF